MQAIKLLRLLTLVLPRAKPVAARPALNSAPPTGVSMSAASDEHTTGTEGTTGQMAGGDPRLDKLVHRLPPRLDNTVTYLSTVQPLGRGFLRARCSLSVACCLSCRCSASGCCRSASRCLQKTCRRCAPPAPRSSTGSSEKPHWLDPSAPKK